MSKNMNQTTSKTMDRLRVLESEVAKLIALRKDEIFKVLEVSGGLTLDNRLLAGLAVYASAPENSDSSLIKELMELGKKKIPSKRNRSSLAKSNKGVSASANAIKEEKKDG